MPQYQRMEGQGLRMNKLNIIVMHKNDNSAFERLISSIKLQNTQDIEITAITDNAEKIKNLKNIIDFDIVECTQNNTVEAINKTVENLSSEFFMIMYQDQLVDAYFFDTFSACVKENDFVLMNMSKKHHGWNFVKLYPENQSSVEECLKIRPSVFCCVFNTVSVQKNQIKLKSFKISDQLQFIKSCSEKAKSPVYEPSVHIYIDEISESSDKSFFSALSHGGYAGSIIKVSVSDIFAAIVKSKLYKNLGRLKRFLSRNYNRAKRLAKRILKKVFRG